jgi:hypothetical protein
MGRMRGRTLLVMPSCVSERFQGVTIPIGLCQPPSLLSASTCQAGTRGPYTSHTNGPLVSANRLSAHRVVPSGRRGSGQSGTQAISEAGALGRGEYASSTGTDGQRTAWTHAATQEQISEAAKSVASRLTEEKCRPPRLRGESGWGTVSDMGLRSQSGPVGGGWLGGFMSST